MLRLLTEAGIVPQYSSIPIPALQHDDEADATGGEDVLKKKCKQKAWQWEEHVPPFFVGRPGLDPAEGRLKPKRAQRKRQQVMNMLVAGDLAIHLLLGHGGGKARKRLTSVVEFAGGTGHIVLPLAHLHPNVQVCLCMDTAPPKKKQIPPKATRRLTKPFRIPPHLSLSVCCP